MLNRPRIDIKDLFAVLFIATGMILFLTGIHILTIQTTGDVNSVMNMVFKVTLNIFMTVGFIAIALVIIHFLKYLAWMTMTPKWLKKKQRNEK